MAIYAPVASASTGRSVRAVAWNAPPDWWVRLVAIGAWGAYVLHTLGIGATLLHSSSPAGAHRPGLIGWTVMTLAMQLPTTRSTVRWLAARSLRRRRHRVVVGYVAGFTLTWVAAGGALLLVASAADVPTGLLDATAPAALVAAAVWHRSRRRRRLMLRCSDVDAPAITGWTAHADCAGAGVVTAARALVLCGPAMLSMLFDHHPVAVGAVTGVMLWEYSVAPNPERRVGDRLGTGALAVAAALLVVARAG